MFLLNLASEHDLIGFQARNVGRRIVEALYEREEGAVRAFEADVRELSPEGAQVERIRFEDYDGPVKDIEKFRSYFTILQLDKMIEVGLSMIQKQDETLQEIRGIRNDLKSILDDHFRREVSRSGERCTTDKGEIGNKVRGLSSALNFWARVSRRAPYSRDLVKSGHPRV